MSTDHKDSGWRKRQIALDKKAENARELGLDYAPTKTVMEMAREAGITYSQIDGSYSKLIAFATRVRADEVNACCDLLEGLHHAQMGNHNYYLYAANMLRDLRGEK